MHMTMHMTKTNQIKSNGVLFTCDQKLTNSNA